MSTMLNLVDQLLARSHQLQQVGRQNDAFDVLLRLTEFEGLPDYAAEEVAIRLAEISLRRRQYKYAQRYLQVAFDVQPENGRTHYLMARALDAGPKPKTRKALEHYRCALELEPDQPVWLCAYGLSLARLGRSREALASLRRAAELAPDELKILKKVVEGMRLANAADEARRILLAARFRKPHDCQILALWNDFRFQELRKDQDTAPSPSVSLAAEPVLLPYVRIEGGESLPPAGGKRIRKDEASGTPAPRTILRVRRPGQRHAQ